MFQKQAFKVKLQVKDNLKQLKQVALAYSDTLVLDGVFQKYVKGRPQKYRKVIHMNYSGSILLVIEQFYSIYPCKFYMMNPKQVITFYQHASKMIELRIVDLQKQQESTIMLPNAIVDLEIELKNDMKFKQCFVFPETQLLAVVLQHEEKQERSYQPYQYTQIVYYNYNEIKEGKARPLTYYLFRNKNLHIEQINNHSKLVIWKRNNHKIVFFAIVDLDCLKHYKDLDFTKLEHPDSEPMQDSMFNRAFIDIEEIKTDLYFISIKYCYFYSQQKCSPRRYGYLDTRGEEPSIQPLPEYPQFKMQAPQLLMARQLGKYTVFYGSKSQFFFTTTCPTFIYNLYKSKMVETNDDYSDIDCISDCTVFPAWDRNFYIRALQASQESQILVFITRVTDMKDSIMHMLLHLNEEFDEDLLQDALELLQ